jgi:uncharacterized SAM-binding protein YcdF (DUF218 family)
MFFVISKLLIYLLFPTVWIFILLIIGLLTKKPKRKKYSFTIAFILFILFSNPFLLDRFAKWWDVKETKLPAGSNYSCAIILGGFGAEDENKNGYFNLSADRFIQAIKLKISGKVSHLLITGGSSKLRPTDFREGDWVHDQFIDLKIPDNNILVENKSRNTLENAIYSKKLLDSAHLQPPYLLVTSAFHMRRSMYIYKKKGVDVIPYPCNYLAGRNEISISDFIPSAGALSFWETYIKEVIGYVVYAIKN